MLRFLFLTVAVCLFFTPGTVYSQKKSDLEKLQIHGKVKKIETFTSSFDGEKGWTNRLPWITEIYNPDGNTIERIVYQNGQLYNKVVSFYDARGRNTGNDSFSSFLDKTFTVPSKTQFVLDDAGNISELRVFSREDGAKVDILHRFKYDARANQIERDYGASGKSVITFDENNNEIGSINYNGKGAVYGKTSTEYDDRNRKTKLTIYGHGMFYEDARLRYEISYQYDARGRIVEQETKEFNVEPNVSHSHAPEPGKVIYRYDDPKRAKETARYTSDGYLKNKSFTIFDERGNEIGFECVDADLKTCKRMLEYEYDAQGNWTRKTTLGREYIGGAPRPYHAELRSISY